MSADLAGKQPVQRDSFDRNKPLIILALVVGVLVVCYFLYQINFGVEWSTSYHEDASTVDLMDMCENLTLPEGDQVVLQVHKNQSHIFQDTYADYLIQVDPAMLEEGQEFAFPGPDIYAVKIEWLPPVISCRDDFGGTLRVVDVTEQAIKVQLTFEGIQKTFTFIR